MHKFVSALDFAYSDAAAREYLLTRRADTEALVADGLGNLPYVAVTALTGGTVLVGHVVCVSKLAAVAYILARYW